VAAAVAGMTAMTQALHSDSRWRAGMLAMLVFSLVGLATCNLPARLADIHLAAFLRLPVEVPLLATALLVFPRRLAKVVACLATILLGCLLVLKLADMGMGAAFQRPFNPYLDGKTIVDGWNVLAGSLGALEAVLVAVVAVSGFAAVICVFGWSCLRMTDINRSSLRSGLPGFVGIAALAIATGAAGHWVTLPGWIRMTVAPYLADRVRLVSETITDQSRFNSELAQVQAPGASVQLFNRIRGHDVILVFVESYGRSAVEDPRYQPLIGSRLAQIEGKLQESGFESASGWAGSPTVGGLSWLAHGSLLSGLWINSQGRYDRLMASRRPSLNRMFQGAGWKTVAVMPAITMDWPEAAYYGYDQIFASKDLGYGGKAFNWVTMPDQYTLAAFERLAREPARASGAAVMAEMALISSHAPWTPVPRLIDWNTVGDGSVFNPQAESGDSPEVVWADHDRVRRQYAETIDYSLQVMEDYIARYGRDAIFVVLGDHQPAEIITGPGASRAVPVHVISRDRTLVESFLGDGFRRGMTPNAQTAEVPMDALRDVLIRRFSGD
jgi:hypothetical protein